MKEGNTSVKEKSPSKTQEKDDKKSPKNEKTLESDFASEIPLLPIIPERSDKGQLISKCPFGVYKYPKKPTKFLSGFLPYLVANLLREF